MKPENSSPGGDQQQSSASNQQAAANLIRSQIDSLYGDQPTASPQPTPQVAQPANATEQDINPYDRTHSAHPQPQADHWKQYHTAWQNYYQKYYEGYYSAQQPQPIAQAAPQQEGYFSHQTDLAETTEELSKDQALFELRQKLLGKVQTSARKIRGSKHFIPIAAATLVILIFVFIQYNRVFIATVSAYVSPGAINPQNIVIDPSKAIAVTSDPRLIIPKINVDVPVLYDVGNDHASQMTAMESGVAHFAIPGASSHPGEIGNTVLSGHSSNDLFDGGDYKFIFAQLEKLTTGDTIYANYNGTRYTYVVTKTEVVKPTEVNKLVYPTEKPMLTLITCTPLGTARDRLLVTAEQVSPDPAAAAAAPAGSGEQGDAEMPGTAPTLFERLFGAN